METKAANYIHRNPRSFPKKMLVGATMPLWLPLAAVGILVSAPVVAPVIAVRRATMSRSYSDFQENPSEYLKQRSEKFLKEKNAEPILEEAKELMKETENVVAQYSSLIPRVIEADRKMIVQLRNETRSQEDVLKLYTPIQRRSEDLRNKMISLGIELYPDTIDRHDLMWEAKSASKIGEGEFSDVYRAARKTGRPSKNGKRNISSVAVKAFKHSFDDLNARFFLNEDLEIR